MQLLVVYDLEHGTQRLIHVKLPAGTHVQDVALSPKGDRLAWLLDHEVAPPNSAAKRALRIGVQGGTLIDIWVSAPDGSGMRRLGSAVEAPVETIGMFSGLHWTPDGKRLSFINADALYSLPAN